MNTKYRRELNALEEVYEAALRVDIKTVVQLIERISQYSLIAVGSGGSYSTASFAADLHEFKTGHIGRAATPLEVIRSSPKAAATVCFSASGRNRDIGVAFQIAAQAEAGPVGAMVLSADTPLHALQKRYSYTDVVEASGSVFKDGFLAVASMITSALLLKRAYDAVLGYGESLPPKLEDFANKTIGRNSFSDIPETAREITSKQYLSLLFSPTMKSTAIDLESRFVEAALGAIHTADYRNFGHGRHHWIAKRSENTGVAALVGKRDEVLATRTLNLLPDNVETWRINISGEPDEQSIAGLIVGLYLSEAAGLSAGIDPGKPGVPGFGRKLYGLGPGALKRKPSDLNRQAAIFRKTADVSLIDSERAAWELAHKDAIAIWNKAPIKAIAFDYDGTLCDSRSRFEPLSNHIKDALTRVVENGVLIGIATGRGPSAGEALRQCLPAKHWPNVVMGYYNGAVMTTLDDDRDPLIGPCESEELLVALKTHPVLVGCDFRSNAAQIALRLPANLDIGETVSAVNSVLLDYGFSAPVTASSHSVDIQFSAFSKITVVDQLQATIGSSGVVMRLGDKGVWPGNDVELLDSPYGLSVDEASRHTHNCWALAPAGVKGIQATLYYLNALKFHQGEATLVLKPGDTGNVYAS